MAKIDDVKSNVETGKRKLVPALVQGALDEGCSPQQILDTMVDAMGIVGDKFSSGQIFVPEMLMAARAMGAGVDVIRPLMAGEGSSSMGTCIIGTVQGDLHDIGKNLVSMMIESVGFKMVDLGVDADSEKFIQAIKDNQNVRLVACSGLLSTTMPALKETVKALKSCGLEGFKVLVGGAPVTQAFADEIGADGYAPDAGGAAVKARELVAA